MKEGMVLLYVRWRMFFQMLILSHEKQLEEAMHFHAQGLGTVVTVLFIASHIVCTFVTLLIKP